VNASTAPKTDARTVAKAVIIGLFVLMQVVLVFLVRYDTLDMDIRPNNHPSPDFYGPIDIGETFVATGANIGRIDLLMGTHDYKVSYPVRFELYEIGASRTLAAASETGASALRNNFYNTFRFPTVRKTRGKKFLFRLLAPEATAANGMAVWMNTEDIYPDGMMMYNGAFGRNDLTFRVYSLRTVASELGRITAKNPGILSSPGLFVLVVLLLEAALIWTLGTLVDRIFNRQEPHV